MIKEVIDNIIQAEKTSEEIVKDSQVQAKEAVVKAKNIAEAMLDDEKKRVKSEIDAMINEAVLKSGTQAKQAISECEKKADEIVENAKKNFDKAQEFIVRSMISKYDS